MTTEEESPLLLTTWERAKRKLFVEITEGRLSDDIPPGKVWDDDKDGGIYKACKRDNFSNNLRELRKRIKKWKDEAEIDRIAEMKDRELFQIVVSGRWPGSKAEKLLKNDIDNEKYPLMSPRELYYSPDRKEYQEFDYQCFRKHIHQEKRYRLTTLYWVALKEEKIAEKALKEAQKEKQRRKAEDNANKPLDQKDLDSMTKDEMKTLCKQLNLKVSGNKKDLAERIQLARQKND